MPACGRLGHSSSQSRAPAASARPPWRPSSRLSSSERTIGRAGRCGSGWTGVGPAPARARSENADSPCRSWRLSCARGRGGEREGQRTGVQLCGYWLCAPRGDGHVASRRRTSRDWRSARAAELLQPPPSLARLALDRPQLARRAPLPPASPAALLTRADTDCRHTTYMLHHRHPNSRARSPPSAAQL